VLQVSENGGTFNLTLDPNQSFAGDVFQLGTDTGSGTLITEITGQRAPSDFTGTGKSDILWRNASTGGAWI